MFLLDDVLLFVPVIVPLVLSWAAFYEVERILHLAATEGDDTSRPAVTRGQYVGLHVRHYLGLLLVPVFSVLAVQDLVKYAAPWLPGESEAGLLLLPIVGLLVFFPVVLRHLWRTEPLADGELRERLLSFSRRQNFRPSELLVWRTDRMIVNAAVAGLVRPFRYVFFTDVLLSRFSDCEVESIFAHEIGHVRRKHLLSRLLVLMLPVVLWFAFSRAFPSLVQAFNGWLAAHGWNADLIAAIAGPVGLAVFAVTAFSRHSRWLEYDADLYAARKCDASGTPAEGCQRMICVLEKLAVVGGMDRHAGRGFTRR